MTTAINPNPVNTARATDAKGAVNAAASKGVAHIPDTIQSAQADAPTEVHSRGGCGRLSRWFCAQLRGLWTQLRGFYEGFCEWVREIREAIEDFMRYPL